VLVDPRPEVGGISTKSDVESGQKAVHACQQSLGPKTKKKGFIQSGDPRKGNSRSCSCVPGRLTLKDDYAVSKVGAHEEIVPERRL
jgi:hypothetical protein